MSEELKWMVVYAASRREKQIARQMEKFGIEHYLPLQKRLQQWSDRKKWVDFPLFSGYIFVRPLRHQKDLPLGISGVLAYVKIEGKRAVLRDEEIEIIRKVEKSGYYVEQVAQPEDFSIGEQVKVIAGPLKDHEVTLVRKEGKDEFLVSFESLGQGIKINLPTEVLQPHKKTPTT